MLIVMSLVALLGEFGIGLAYVIFMTRRESRLAAVRQEVDDAIGSSLKRSDQANTSFVQSVVDGVPIERAVADFRAQRASKSSSRYRNRQPLEILTDFFSQPVWPIAFDCR